MHVSHRPTAKIPAKDPAGQWFAAGNHTHLQGSLMVTRSCHQTYGDSHCNDCWAMEVSINDSPAKILISLSKVLWSFWDHLSVAPCVNNPRVFHRPKPMYFSTLTDARSTWCLPGKQGWISTTGEGSTPAHKTMACLRQSLRAKWYVRNYWCDSMGFLIYIDLYTPLFQSQCLL